MERTVRFDDLDGSIIEEGGGGTVTVGFGDESYTLDLTEKHITDLQKALTPYLDAGRKIGPEREQVRMTSLPSQPNRSSLDRKAMGDIRKWARKNGFKVSERGRIPHAVMAAYTKEHLSMAR